MKLLHIAFIHCALFFITLSSYADCLSGNYTIGGEESDFVHINDAVSALEENGVCGPVSFNITTGKYNEQIVIPDITGASEENTISFIGAGDGPEETMIEYYGRKSDSNFVVKFDASKHLSFKNLSITSTSRYEYSILVEVTDYCENMLFDNVGFIGSSYIDSEPLVNADADNLTSIHFSKCNFTRGNTSLHFPGESSNISISDCSFSNFKYRAMYFKSVYNISISNNYINVNLAPASGLYLASTKGNVVFTSNRINAQHRDGHIDIGGSFSEESHLFIANNAAVFRTGHLSLRYFTTVEMYNNTFVSFDRDYPAVELNGISTIVANNNIFLAESKPAIYINRADQVTCDHNCYFSEGNTVIEYGTDDYSSLVDWQQNTDNGDNSIFYYPSLSYNEYNLLKAEFDFVLDNKGTPINSVQYDIDSFPRSATPDIGAYEYSLLRYDASLTKLDAHSACACPGEYPIKGDISNNGTNEITSLKIYAYKNDFLVDSILWEGTIASGDTLKDLFLYTAEYIGNNEVSYKFQITEVNGVKDVNNFNDSNIQKTGTVKTALKGDYSIGGVSPDFETFEEAITAMKEEGVCDSVRILVHDGEYEEVIRVSNIRYNQPTDYVIFEGKSHNPDKVQIKYPWGESSFYKNLIWVNNDNITFKYISLKSSPATLYDTYEIVKLYQSNNITFSDCKLGCYLKKDDINYYADGIIALSCRNVRLENLDIYNCANALNIDASDMVEINNCSTSGFLGNSIYVGYSDTVSIHDCHLQGSENNLNYNSVYIYRSKSIDVYNNDILNITGKAFYINESKATVSTPVRIWNNSISHFQSYAFKIRISKNIEILHNSVNSLPNTENDNSVDIFDYYDSDSIVVLNNNVSNTTVEGKYVDMQDVSNLVSNNNNIYIPNGTISKNTITLQEWQAKGNESLSVAVDPQFVGPTNLNILQNIDLENKGVHIPWLRFDKSGFHRDNTPDIGAYKINSNKVADVGLEFESKYAECRGSEKIRVNLTNNGTDTLRICQILVQINNNPIDSIEWKGALPSTETVYDVPVKSYYFSPDTVYNLKVWAKSPNYVADKNLDDNLLEVADVDARMGGSYTIGGIDPNYPTIAAAVAAIHKLGICDTVRFLIRNGVYKEDIFINEFEGNSMYQVLIESELNDSDSVRIDGIIQIDGVSNITIQNLSFGMSSEMYNINILNSTDNIIIQNNELRSGIYATDGSHTNHRVTKNHFVSWGVRYVGAEQGDIKNITVTNNTFEHSQTSISYGQNIDIIENIFIKSYRESVDDRLELKHCIGNIEIGYNSIITDHNSRGISIHNCSGTKTKPIKVHNNVLSIKYTAIEVFESNYIDIIHNTLHSDSKGIGVYGEHIRVLNNIIELFSGGYFHDIRPTAQNIICDYNLYHNPLSIYSSSKGAFHDGEAFHDYSTWTFDDWQENTDFDQHSIVADPGFVSPYDLHLNHYNYETHYSGYPLTDYTDDFDHDTRSMTHVSFGADQFEKYKNDLNVIRLVQENQPPCIGKNPLEVDVSNNGSVPIHSFVLHWSIDGTLQKPFKWEGELATYDTITVVLGNIEYEFNENYDFEVYPLTVNDVLDEYSYLDTLKGEIKTGLSGVVTVGGDKPDFETLQEAFDSVGAWGICGELTISVREGLYYGNIEIPQYKRAADDMWITVEGEPKDSSKVVFLNSWHYTLDGRNVHHLKFKHVGVHCRGNAWGAVSFSERSHNITFENCSFISREDNNNRDELVYVGYVHQGNASTGYFRYNHSFTFMNNHFEGTSELGLTIEGPSFVESRDVGNFVIKQNTFVNLENTIVIRNAYSFDISSNKFHSEDVSGEFVILSAQCKISIRQCYGNGIIQGNKMYSEYGGTGISVYFFRSIDNDSLLISNNEFAYKESIKSGCALSVNNSKNIVFAHNTIKDVAGSTNGLISLKESDSIDIINNHIISEGNQSCVKSVESENITADYNNFWTAGSFWVVDDVEYATLEDLTVLNGSDFNSISIDPQFVSDSILFPQNTDCYNTGKVLEEVPFDITGKRRDIMPDIGAYEGLATLDLSVSDLVVEKVSQCSDEYAFYADIKNVGLDPVSSFNVYLLHNEKEYKQDTWNGELLSLESLPSFKLPILDLTKTDEIRLIISSVNEQQDMNSYNDTILFLFNPADFEYVFDLGDSISTCKPSVTVEAPAGMVSYSWTDGSSEQLLSVTETGTYYVTATDANDCQYIDSIYVLIDPAMVGFYEKIEASICAGDEFEFSDMVYTEAGIHEITLKNGEGCDSIYEIDLTVYDTAYVVVDTTVCEGQSVFIGNNEYFEAGQYTTQLSTQHGCDSTVVLNLKTYPSSSEEQEHSICNGESITLNDSLLNETGTYVFDLKNQYGCDSIVTVSLSVFETDHTYLNEFIIEGEKYSFGEELLDESGIYNLFLTNQAGCDSLVELTLEVVNIDTTYINDVFCENGEYNFNGAYFIEAGDYEIALKNQNGIDSIIKLSLEVIAASSASVVETICPGDEYVVGAKEYRETGIYQVKLQNSNGCDSIVNLDLTVSEFEELFSLDTITSLTNSVEIEASPNFHNYEWSIGAGDNIIRVTQKNDTEIQRVSLVAYNDDECKIEDSIFIKFINVETAIFNQEKADQKLYPNPTSDFLYIQANSIYEMKTVRLLSVSGIVVLETIIDSSQEPINLRTLPEGTYMIEVLDSVGQREYASLIIKK